MPQYFAGIDIGSLSAQAVILSEGKILSYSNIIAGVNRAETAERVLDIALEKTELSRDDIKYVVGTGYGRYQVPFADKNVTEITCHSIGVHSLNPEILTLIDIGGQDSKVIRIGLNGRPTDFELNDKCSAGTGRFLEVMAQVLELPINELGPLSLKAPNPSFISSTCTVFAESEVIGRIGAGDNPADIAAGVHKAMAAKIATLSQRVGVEPPIAVTGGVALNPGFRHYLSQELKSELWVPEAPQYTGALGAAILALG